MQMMPMQMPMMGNAGGMAAAVPNLEGVLYVGNLHPNVNEYQLFEVFSQYGRPQLVRLMRDAYTGESRRFAFVSYTKRDDAENAKKALNYTKIFDREIRICFKRAPGEFKANANIFIKNLDKAVTTKQLEEHTTEFGEILSCVVRTGEDGESLGYGYVQYKTEEAAKRAIEALNEKTILGSEWSVNEFVPRKNRVLEQKKNLYVKHFPAAWDKEKVESELNNLFSEFGTITSNGVYEYTDKEGKTKYYSFVAYDSVESASNAINELNGKSLEGKVEEEEELYVGYAQNKNQRKEMLKKKHLTYQSVTNLYIKSLTPETTEEKIREIFSKWGKITSVCLKSASKNIAKNLQFGFVNYATAEEANAAYAQAKNDEEVKKLIDSSHFPNVDFIYYAQPKSMRVQYLRMKEKNRQAMRMNMMSMMGGFGMFGHRPGPKFPPRNRNAFKSGPGSASSGSGMGGFTTMNPLMSGPNSMMTGPDMGFGQMGMGGGFNFGMPGMPQPGFGGPMQAPSFNSSNNPGSTSSAQHNSVHNVSSGMDSVPTSFLNSVNNTTGQNQTEEVEETHRQGETNVRWLKENKNEFMAMSEEDQKNLLGHLMYQRVMESGQATSDLVPKITGMLIDLEILEYEEIIDILENDLSLKERIAEAIEVMNDSN